MYQRIVMDKDILRDNPAQNPNRIQQIAIRQLRHSTRGVHGEEKWKLMREKAFEVYNSMIWAIDEVDKDMTLNPIMFLGIALYPYSLF